jgi:methyltransferase family protein
MERARLLDDLGPLYHSYRFFGVDNPQIVNFAANQRCKEAIILSYILNGIAKSRSSMNEPVSFAELFCADGYFTMLAARLGATSAIGIDSNRDGHSAAAPVIAGRLGLNNVRFDLREVDTITELDAYDVVANIGGLYHVSNPIEILRKSYDLAKRYLIVQSVVSLASNRDDYFVSPAPGWQHGCRFSPQSFTKMVESQGYRILDRFYNELEGNARPEDRGSVYFLIEKYRSGV